MITLPQLTELLGWAALINVAYLFIATFTILFLKDWITSIHSKMFNVSGSELDSKYFDFLSHYKIVTLVFMVAPYIALKIMGQ